MPSNKHATIDAAVQCVRNRVRKDGLKVYDVPRDGACFFHGLAWWLPELLGKTGTVQLLNSTVVNHAAVRSFLCDWAAANRDAVLGDEGGESVAELAVRAALHDWPTPIGAFSWLPPKEQLAAQFDELIQRMRRGEWADDFWVTSLAPAALGFKIDVKSSSGTQYDRPPQPLARWMPNFELWQTRDTITLGHAVVNGEGTHYFVVPRTPLLPPLPPPLQPPLL